MPGERDIDGGNWGTTVQRPLPKQQKLVDDCRIGGVLYLSGGSVVSAKRAEVYSGGTLTLYNIGTVPSTAGDTAAGIKQLSAGSLDMVIRPPRSQCQL